MWLRNLVLGRRSIELPPQPGRIELWDGYGDWWGDRPHLSVRFVDPFTNGWLLHCWVDGEVIFDVGNNDIELWDE